MNYIFGLMMNIVSLAAVVCFTVVLFTWFILFPLWALEIRIDEKNTMTNLLTGMDQTDTHMKR